MPKMSIPSATNYPPTRRARKKPKNIAKNRSQLLIQKFMYRGTLVPMKKRDAPKRSIEVDRVQTGVRIEKRLLKVLKAVAELKDMSLGDLLEGIVLHAFEGKTPFSAQTLKDINQFRSLYGMTLRASDSHHLKERK
jgi:hypothetical protein